MYSSPQDVSCVYWNSGCARFPSLGPSKWLTCAHMLLCPKEMSHKPQIFKMPPALVLLPYLHDDTASQNVCPASQRMRHSPELPCYLPRFSYSVDCVSKPLGLITERQRHPISLPWGCKVVHSGTDKTLTSQGVTSLISLL